MILAIKNVLSKAKDFIKRTANKFTKRAYNEIKDKEILKKQTTKIIDKAIKQGKNPKGIFSDIKHKARQLKNRIKLIARTEATRAENTARMKVIIATRTRQEGKKTVKVWHTQLDPRVRPSHQLLHGEERDLDEPFSNDLMFPGDPEGDASEVCNCRCYITKKVVDE